jgi:hypothetical protein
VPTSSGQGDCAKRASLVDRRASPGWCHLQGRHRVAERLPETSELIHTNLSQTEEEALKDVFAAE